MKYPEDMDLILKLKMNWIVFVEQIQSLVFFTFHVIASPWKSPECLVEARPLNS